MRTLFSLFLSLLALTAITHTAHAQLPYVSQVFIYSSSGNEYIGKYWPANTPAADAVRMDYEAKNANPSSPPMRLFEGCDDLKLRIRLIGTIPDDKVIYMKFRFYDYSSAGGVNTRAAITLPDSVAIPHGVSYFEVPYQINHLPDDQNGGLAAVRGYISNPNGSENSGQTDYVNMFNRFTYHVEYSPRTVQYKGHLRLNIQEASPQIVCSLDGGYTWRKPQDEFSGSIVDKALEAGVIYIKEPNSCLLVTIPFGKGSGGIGEPGNSGDPGSSISRQITMPYIANAIINREQGVHYVSSGGNFVFTIQPTGANAGLVPVVSTNRTGVPDSEGVKIEDNGDGSYTVSILRVQQTITLSIDFATSNKAIDNGNKVWADNDQLYIQSTTNGTANIYNAAGTLVKSTKVSAGEITVVSIPTGFYVVKMSDDKTYKIILR